MPLELAEIVPWSRVLYFQSILCLSDMSNTIFIHANSSWYTVVALGDMKGVCGISQVDNQECIASVANRV